MSSPIDGIDLPDLFEKLGPHVRPTLLLAPEPLQRASGLRIRLASETFQHTGSFKYRAALAVALHSKAPHLIAASSGNFGAGLALSARQTGKACTIVMPTTSARVKMTAVRGYGAEVDLVDTSRTTRKARVAELIAEHPEARAVSAYDDAYVIAGNASLGREILRDPPEDIVVPVGGGGLSSGIVVARDLLAPQVRVIGAEPRMANDAARSLREGKLVSNESEPLTLCDGARTLSLGERNYAILRTGLEDVIEVEEDAVAKAVRLLFESSNLKVEPTGALAVAAVLSAPERFAGRRVTCVVSGGNVDTALYAHLLTASDRAEVR